MSKKDILNRSFKELGFDREFSLLCQRWGCRTPGDIMRTSLAELVSRPGFSYHWLEQFVVFLKANDLLAEWESSEGNNVARSGQ